MDISCTLDEKGLAEQRRRYRRVAAAVTKVQWGGDRLTVDLGPDLDRGALDELIAVESECCPFFVFGFDDASRRLEVGVDDPRLAPALDAIAGQLTQRRGAD